MNLPAGRPVAVPFETDVATLAVFDPKALLHRMRQPSTWWREAPIILDVPEVLEGKAALFPIGQEGSYSVRATLDAAPLTAIEQPLVRGVVGPLGLAVVSEDVFFGAAERLPGEGIGDRVVQIPGTGGWLKVPPGDYDVSVHVVDWRRNKSFYDEDGEPLPEAPPDFVVALSKRERAFDAPNELGALIDLIPRAEASAASLRVPTIVRRAPSPEPRGRRSAAPAGFMKDDRPAVEEPPAPPSFGPWDTALIRRAFRDVVADRERLTPHASWAGGTLALVPRDRSLQAKEIPVEDLLGKVTRVRENLRVLEQKVNGHEGLEDETKLALDAFVTAAYEAATRLGSVLTTPALPAAAPPPAAPPP